HHAGVGHRAHQGDRHPQGARRHQVHDPEPVPDRGAGAVPVRRHHRHRPGCGHVAVRQRATRLEHRDLTGGCRGGLRLLGLRGTVLRTLAGASRGQPGSDPGAALRVIPWRAGRCPAAATQSTTGGALPRPYYFLAMRIAVLSLLIAVPLAAQAPAPTVAIPRIETSTNVDGSLDEPVWRQAARLDGFYQYRPVDSRPAEDSTVVLLWYSPDAIHVGILAYDREPQSVRATLSDRDNIGSDDQVTIFLDTFNDRRRAYFFGVNPLGVQDDGMRAEGGFSTSGFGSGTQDRNPDFLWQSKGRLTSFGWQVEVRIPFKSLRWGGSGEMTWGFNVQRVTRRTGYEDT